MIDNLKNIIDFNLQALISCCTLILFLSLNGCGQTYESELNAVVTEKQAQNAFDIIERIDYLPFQYKTDGCYGRSIYMAMELAAQGIPSSSQYIQGELKPQQGVSWRGHVAPMIVIDGLGINQKIILDPSLSAGPLTEKLWINAVNPKGEYKSVYRYGSHYMDQTNWSLPDDPDPLVRDISEMPVFRKEDVLDACGDIYRYLNNPGIDGVWYKKDKLVSRTQQLVKDLWDRQLLDEEISPKEVLCGQGVDLPMSSEQLELLKYKLIDSYLPIHFELLSRMSDLPWTSDDPLIEPRSRLIDFIISPGYHVSLEILQAQSISRGQKRELSLRLNKLVANLEVLALEWFGPDETIDYLFEKTDDLISFNDQAQEILGIPLDEWITEPDPW